MMDLDVILYEVCDAQHARSEGGISALTSAKVSSRVPKRRVMFSSCVNFALTLAN